MPVQTQFKRADATRNIMQKSGRTWSDIFGYKEKTISEHTQCSIHKALLTHLAVSVPRTRIYQKFIITITHTRNYMHNITQFWHVLSIFINILRNWKMYGRKCVGHETWFIYRMLSFGQFPSIWSLYADILEHSVCPTFIGR